MRGRIATFYAVGILVVWVLTSVNGMVRGDYAEFSIATPVILAIIGLLFAVKNGNNGK